MNRSYALMLFNFIFSLLMDAYHKIRIVLLMGQMLFIEIFQYPHKGPMQLLEEQLMFMILENRLRV